MKTALPIAAVFLATGLAAQVPRPGSLDLGSVAERIDPGPQPPLDVSIPETVRAWLESLDPQGSLEDAVGRLLSDLTPGGTYSSELFVAVLSVVLIIERATAEEKKGSMAWRQALLRAYGAIAPLSRFPSEYFSGMARLQDPESLRNLEWLRKDGSVLAESLLAHTAAEVLRGGSDEATVDEALWTLSAAERRAENPDLALALFEEGMRRLGDEAELRDWIGLAELYYMTGEFDLGDHALQRSRSGPVETLTGSEGMEAWKNHAERVKVRELGLALHELQHTAEQDDLEGQLARARLWGRMGLRRRASELYERLASEHPDDARPLIGLVEEAIEAGNLGVARGILSRASDLANRDAIYYGVSFYLSLVWDLPRLRQMANRGERERLMGAFRRILDENVTRAREVDEGLGTALSLISELIEAMSEARGAPYLRELLPRIVELRAKFPDFVPTYTLALGSAIFHPDEEAAFDTVLAGLPERSDRYPELALGRAMTYLALCYRSGRDPVELDRLTDELARDQGVPFDRELIRGTAAALRESWQRAEALLRRSVAPESMPHRAWALNNLAFAVHRLGRTSEAVDLWRQSEDAQTENGVATLNRLVVNAAEGLRDPAVLQELEVLSGGAEVRRLVKVQALCWLGLAKEEEEPETALAHFRSAVALLDEEESMAGFPELPGDGVTVIGRSAVGLGYVKESGIQLRFDTSPELWLLLPAPIDEETLREKASR